ncbi:hypothetical protein Mth01_56250 [Sphaerimonospora thailandensis]|uniref:Uncharacterized protein n=1 Tax=Sphaerimonospora thailandensis TaxID=795644 RepID=A0A8J3RCT3_9ACTN|nr:hypothetical protein Mth01_56250 [Sphaerimonospora thailandensis]
MNVQGRNEGRRARVGAAALVSLVLVGCQPYARELFIVTNETEETVVVSWSDGRVYATLHPGESAEQMPPAERCLTTPLPADRFYAKAESGKRYDYGRPPCAGERWRIGATASPRVSPS